ncbi:hypothetical protein Syun_013960 [Stephania yunnanensis]|uniref:Cation/H+ exchanger domain-containing protein n=1 Tax=Stephania yunnanensis TaxID=152371 RepID=A0AAP0JJ69_9MAGN
MAQLPHNSYDINQLIDGKTVVCFAPEMLASTGVWQGNNPFNYSVPTVILQLALAFSVNRILIFALKPLRQPRVIADIIGGILLGPSGLARNINFEANIFSIQGMLVLDMLGSIGILFYLFLVGVEMDIMLVRRTGKKSLMIALCGMILPFLVGALGSLTMPGNHIGEATSSRSFVVFIALSQAVTSFPVLAQILAELKLLNSDLGKIALSSAVISDGFAWLLLALAVTFTKGDSSSWVPLSVILANVAFVCFCIFVIRPAICWVDRNTPEGEDFNEVHIILILTGVMICGFITASIGTHAIIGAFVYGLIIPKGRLGSTIVEKLQDFVTGLLLPIFYVKSGFKTNLRTIEIPTWFFIFPIIFLAGAAKVGGILLVSMFYQIPSHEGVTLGLVMNAKGLIEIVILNMGKSMKVLNDQAFAVMMVVSIVTTAIITPTVTAFHKPERHFVSYKRRTIQRSKLEAELRMMVCIHIPRNVPTMINLLEATHPSRKSPICIYVVNLVELTSRTSAMLIVHTARQSGQAVLNRTRNQSDQILSAFENFEQYTGGVSIQPLTVVSPYPTMHEDICNLAENKHVAFIILPFHKQLTVDGGMKVTNPAYRTMNQNVLANAPCSVGILVDKGFSGSTKVASGAHGTSQIIVFFFGGPDDREALSYAKRMLEHPGIILTVIRFVPGKHTFRSTFNHQEGSNGQGSLTVMTDTERARQLDEEVLNDFKSATHNNGGVVYEEKVVNNGEETLAAIRSIEKVHDLYIVGRCQYMDSPLMAGLNDWSECPELGTIGDILASPDFSFPVSVLVVQQYVGENTQVELVTPETPSRQKDIFSILNVHHRTPRQVKLGNS